MTLSLASSIQAQSQTVLLPVFLMNLMRSNVHITTHHMTSLLLRTISGSVARSCVELVGALLCFSVLHKVNIQTEVNAFWHVITPKQLNRFRLNLVYDVIRI
jgi:hypothetical protein